MKRRMFWGIYKCPECGKTRIILTRFQYNALTICVTNEARRYHYERTKVPRRCYLGFTASILCKKCSSVYRVDRHNDWKIIE